MAEQPNETTLPSHPAPAATSTEPSAAAEGEAAGEQSKKGAKKAAAKAAKEAEKARKAAEREQAAAASSSTAAEDLARENYGDVNHKTKLSAEEISLSKLGEEHVGKTIELYAWIQNSRAQGAKMAFVELREERGWAIQGVVAASNEGKPVSKQMVKWVNGLRLESFVAVEAIVQKPLEPVKSCKVSDYELHITKFYLIAPAPEVLGMGMGPANKAPSNIAEEDNSESTTAGMFFS